MRFVSILLVTFLLLGCMVQSEEGSAESSSAEPHLQVDASQSTAAIKHSVPLDEIYFDTFRSYNRTVPYDEASPRLIESLLDKIPPIHEPVYESAENAVWLSDKDSIIGYASGDNAWAYPIKILNFHEIVNDTLNGEPLLISYCPLCYSGVIFSRTLGDRELTFGNTSALYESDMVMIDYETGSYWWQIAGRAILGELTDQTMTVLPSQMTTWGEWKTLYPDTVILSRDTGYERPYETNSFASYEGALDAGQFSFPVSEAGKDTRLPASARVLTLASSDGALGYPLIGKRDVISDEIDGRQIIIFVDGELETGAGFYADSHQFEVVDGRFFDKASGSEWNMAGSAIAGELVGEQLTALPSKVSYWFAIVAAEPDIQLVHRSR